VEETRKRKGKNNERQGVSGGEKKEERKEGPEKRGGEDIRGRKGKRKKERKK
jgi:hypothetical protein